MNIILQGKNYHWSFKKFIIHLFILVFVISFGIIYISNIAKATNDKKVIEIIVHRGDTLWSIAQQIAPQSDPRVIIRQIRERNRIFNSDLIAGQRLEVEIASIQ
jgi:LysM domain.